MKFPRTTLVLVLMALGLSGFVYFHEIKNSAQREAVSEQKKQVLSLQIDDIQSLIIKTNNSNLELERKNTDAKPQWSIKSPVSEPANDAIVSYLLDLLAKGKTERILSVPPNQLAEFGLDQPQATIDIKLKNQQSHQIILGRADFTGNLVYAQVDPATQVNGNINVLLVSKDFGNAVNRDLSEWKNLENNLNLSPTPLPSPTSLPTPTDIKKSP
ncbi:hypothetical protein B6N60_02041 [Richelia sinica FACHB-800]|uniref:DUF4340 domain-containing protein n=1 Tax=Richelia sinica FACHB-800 TaxID=1357546 RepID=A0A975T8J8_9NOST|nr:DUF4340 domain-containing protein [Richelia sinica]MBD2665969.1 DUF4340 domain-containing protein [Richelia sinica FACHB-800]QXE23351.1 hypothetical protein B6N60_02041 [Richelia sinica FACHB-800]